VRFGDYLNYHPLPAILAVFPGGALGKLQADHRRFQRHLFGHRRAAWRAGAALERGIEGRPYTTIESSMIRRMVEIILADAEQAFAPVSAVRFAIDRLETNPRFCGHFAAPRMRRSW